jgi:hypothetical protein
LLSNTSKLNSKDKSNLSALNSNQISLDRKNIEYSTQLNFRGSFAFDLKDFNVNFIIKYILNNLQQFFSNINVKTFSFGFLYLRGLFVILFIDACLTDDEPL